VAQAQKTGKVDTSTFNPICAQYGQLAQRAQAFFPIPDPQADSSWRTFISQAQKGSQLCLRAIAQENPGAFYTAIVDLGQAVNSLVTAVEGLSR
jgi:hypothetical protein